MLFYLLLDEKTMPYPTDSQVLSVFGGGMVRMYLTSLSSAKIV
jgi:hypothetical protein